MSDWWLRQANVGTALREQPAALTYHVQYPWLLYIGIPLALLLGVGIVRVHQRYLTASPRVRRTLTLCRVGILLLLMLIFAGPFVRLDSTRTTKPIVVVLVDQSASMRLPAGAKQPTRAEVVRAAFKAHHDDFWPPLTERFDVRVYGVGRTATPTNIERVVGEATATASTTRLGDALQDVLTEVAGQPLAGVIVVSDGVVTGGRSLSTVADAYRTARVPVLCVPVGAATKMKDVAIVDVSSSGQVTLGDTARVAVVLESHGYDDRTVSVVVRDGAKVLDTKEITLRSAEQQQVELQFTAHASGPRYLLVEVAPQADEEHRTNNTDQTLLRVTDDKLKVLYLEGPPRWDYRFLKNALRRDTGIMGRTGMQPEIIVETEWRRLALAEQQQALPQTLDELAAYHTIIIGDVSTKLLTPAFVKLLGQAVRERGVGLLVEAGAQALPHTHSKEFLELLPVQVAAQPGMDAPAGKPFQFELTAEGLLHEAMQLYDTPDRTQTAWKQMQPFPWCAAVIRPLPGATVLAVNASVQNNYGKLPLLAWHTVGQGRVFFVGLDATWLWRQNAADRFFYKFWGQAVRFVARTEENGKKKNWLEVKPVNVAPGDRATLELTAYTNTGAPLQQPSVTVAVAGAHNGTVTLAADPQTKGRYVGTFTVPTPGAYTLSYDNAETHWHSLLDTEEWRNPNAEHPALRALSSATGGRVVELSAADWPALLLGHLHGEATSVRLTPQDATLWDNWLLLCGLVGLYALDIGLRRWVGLA